jgi:DNA-binding NtrC family response regulator
MDHRLPDGTALDLLPRLKALYPDVPVVVLTGHGTIELAVAAIKEGAEQFLTKPVELPSLLAVLRRLIDARRERQRERAGASREARAAVDPFSAASPSIAVLREQAGRVATVDSPVLILGETGVGKGVLAKWLHQHGPRRAEPFVDLNCAGLSRELLESELMGHERGAFTGAVAAKQGLLEISHRGTLFLDEIGDMDPLVQAKLLTVLEEKRFRRLGDVRDRQVDVRLIAATHHDLAQLVREGRFRSDLYFRISTIPLVVPPLRERPADIPLLAHQLLRVLSRDLGRPDVTLSPEAEEALQRYAWPGNIRELRNVLERAALLGAGDVLVPQDLRFEVLLGATPQASSAADPGPAAEGTLEDVEREHIERTLQQVGGRVEAAAQRLGLARSSLYAKIKRYGLTSSEK